MEDRFQSVEVPLLREHSFESQVSWVGPLISWLRRTAYRLTARWGVWSVIVQQNHINRVVAQHMSEFDQRLVDQDRELGHLRRTLAELEARQRQLEKTISSHSAAESPIAPHEHK